MLAHGRILHASPRVGLQYARPTHSTQTRGAYAGYWMLPPTRAPCLYLHHIMLAPCRCSSMGVWCPWMCATRCLAYQACAVLVLWCAVLGCSHVDRLRAQRARVVIPIPATTDTLLGRSDDADCRFRQAVVDFVSQVLQEQRPTAVRMAKWFWIPFKITPVQAYAAIERGVELYFKSALLLCRSYTLPAASSPGRCGVLQQRRCAWGSAHLW